MKNSAAVGAAAEYDCLTLKYYSYEDKNLQDYPQQELRTDGKDHGRRLGDVRNEVR